MATPTKSRVLRIVPLLLAICLYSVPAQAQYSGGSGTFDDPYQIATAEDLIALGETPGDYDKHFILTDDIDLDPNLPGGRLFDRAVIAPDTNDTTWEFDGIPFTGVFDGDDYVISNVHIQGSEYLGLFGQLVSGAMILNLGLEAVDVNGTGEWVGGLVGHNEGDINTTFSTGTIRGISGAIGGLVGGNHGSIAASYSNCMVTGLHSVGGLVGSNDGNITTSYSTGLVTGENIVGGLVGNNSAKVSSCYSTSTVSGDSRVGGLVGTNTSRVGSNFEPSITESYSTGTVSGDRYVGGLVGHGHSYEGAVTRSFWDVETSVQSSSDGGIRKTTAEMQSAVTFLIWGTCGNEATWTINEGRDYPRLWWENKPGEPIAVGAALSDFLTGSGTKASPYLVYSADELNLIGLFPCDLDKHFKLMADIDLSSFSYDTALIAHDIGYSVGNYFTGVFDGNGHTVLQLTITGGDYLGLFGGLTGEIRNLGVVDVNMIGSSPVGGLVGYNSGGTITNCYVSGSISGDGSVGGLVGDNDGSITTSYSAGIVNGGNVGGLVGNNWGSITMSYSMGDVIGDYDVGGLVGDNTGLTANSYSLCSVFGGNRIGGFVGSNGYNPLNGGFLLPFPGNIINCYSAGSVDGMGFVGGLVGFHEFGEAVNSFWDIEVSGQVASGGGTGKTTDELQKASNFLDEAWDFVSETLNGPNDVWKMWDGHDYPRLAWEPGPNTPLVFVDINDSGFYGQMSKYEVTNAQYCDFLNAALASGDIIVNGTKIEGTGGSNSGEDYAGQLYYNGDGSGYTGYGATNGGAARIRYNAGAFVVDDGFGNHPVTYVSWYGAMAFANYYGYYLPAEDQWQAVADYDGTYIYGCGETIDPGIANYRASEHPDGTMPVGSFGAYGYGMSDMAGNVWEWTSSSLGGNRVFRGGSMGSVESDCAVSIRGDGISNAAYWDIGFRVCR